jgi:hypothetical protein
MARRCAMNEELRNAIGKALYEYSLQEPGDYSVKWDALSNKEQWMRRAEKVVETFLQPFLPVLAILSQELISLNPKHEETIRMIYKEAIGENDE